LLMTNLVYWELLLACFNLYLQHKGQICCVKELTMCPYLICGSNNLSYAHNYMVLIYSSAFKWGIQWHSCFLMVLYILIIFIHCFMHCDIGFHYKNVFFSLYNYDKSFYVIYICYDLSEMILVLNILIHTTERNTL